MMYSVVCCLAACVLYLVQCDISKSEMVGREDVITSAVPLYMCFLCFSAQCQRCSLKSLCI